MDGKFPEVETSHIFFDTETPTGDSKFAKNVNVTAHQEYTSIKNGKLKEADECLYTIVFKAPNGAIYFPYSSPYLSNIDNTLRFDAPKQKSFDDGDPCFLDHWEIAGKGFPSLSATDRPHIPGHYVATVVYSESEKTYTPTIHIIRTYPEVIDGINKIAVVASWSNDETNYEISQIRIEISSFPDMSSSQGSTSKLKTDTGAYAMHVKIKDENKNKPYYFRAKMVLTDKNTSEAITKYSEITGVMWSQMWDSI